MSRNRITGCLLLIDSKGGEGTFISIQFETRENRFNELSILSPIYTCYILGSQIVNSLKSSFDIVFSRDNRLVFKCWNRGMRGRKRGEVVDRLESWQRDNASIVRATPLEQAFPRFPWWR